MSTNRATIEGELVQLLAGVLNLEPAQVKLGEGLAEIGINSLQLVEAIFVIEERYGISIPYNANDGGVESVGTLLDLIVGQIEAKAGNLAVADEA
jgi:acyl carrier protein